MTEEVIFFRFGAINLARARKDWHVATTPIIERDRSGRRIGPELEEDTDRRYEACRSIIERLLDASHDRRHNLYGFVRRLIAETRAPNERMILAQDYVVLATKRGMFYEALDGCTSTLLPEAKARFEAFAYVVTKHKAFRTKWHFAQLRQLAEAVKNTDIDQGARCAAWREVWKITQHAYDQERMEAEYPPNANHDGAMPKYKTSAFI